MTLASCSSVSAIGDMGAEYRRHAPRSSRVRATTQDALLALRRTVALDRAQQVLRRPVKTLEPQRLARGSFFQPARW